MTEARHNPGSGGVRGQAAATLELVDVAGTDTFKIWSHGYPFRTVRWHYHPEYEVHLVTATRGRVFVGDHIGPFGPGHLVLAGPNLPHNWISDTSPGEVVEQRCIVLQFTEATAQRIGAALPELRPLAGLLRESARGLQFSQAAGAAALPVLSALLGSAGVRRVSLFFELLGILLSDERRTKLASVGYQPTPEEYSTLPLNHVLAHIDRNLASDLRETDLAALSGYTASAFSRAFRRHTGLSFVDYVNSLRINRACELLIRGQHRVADICFEVGFNNLSNFNRQFLARKRMPPSAFRDQHLGQAAPAQQLQQGEHRP